ncbi:MAG TPA: hypothetical protein VH601_09495 [Bryobacteraceae bacterium]|jgi:hypothetical protein
METPVLVPPSIRKRCAFACLAVALACLRLSHVNLLWADEDYHLAAAINILHGKLPYRDFWYDKPPLCAAYYLLNAGYSGWSLRLLDAASILLACWLVYRLTRSWWGPWEGWTAALLLAFFTTFYLPSTVIPFAADALMMVPHLAAVYAAFGRRALWAGFWSGIAFLFNTKGLFVLAVCLVWTLPEVVSVLLGFAIPVSVSFLGAWAAGAWPGYWEQVWRWGLIYAQGSPVTNPVALGFRRTLDWLGFHAAVAVGAVFAFARIARGDGWKLATWLAFSFAAVCIGTRFAPHYFLQLLPAMVIPASRGFVLAWRQYGKVSAFAFGALLLVPLIRFGPRYARLAVDDIEQRQPEWSDVVLDVDSRGAAEKVRLLARPGDTLFVWGYRPDIYVYTRMIPDGLFGDSQPLTGVPADRHLRADTPIYSAPASANRKQLAASTPTFIVDGLGLLNPKLAPSVYPELRPWVAHYRLVGRTKLTLIYRRLN